MLNKQTLLLLMFSVFLLGSCANVKDILGYQKHEPNAFAVLPGKPLIIPKKIVLPVPYNKKSKSLEIKESQEKAMIALFGHKIHKVRPQKAS